MLETFTPKSRVPHGMALLNDPTPNKGTAFTVEERRQLGIEGLLHSVDTLDRRVERVLGHLQAETSDLEMDVYKPLMIFNITHSITILTDGCTNFRKFLVEGTRPNLKKIDEYVEKSLMLVTALSPVIGYDKALKIVNCAMEKDLTHKSAALQPGFVTEPEFDSIVDPAKMVHLVVQ
jgi:Fumarase C C-terminus